MPGVLRPRRRTAHVPMPVVWGVIASEFWGIDQALTWKTWQALASCEWSEVRSLRLQLLLIPTIHTGKEAALSHGLTPQRVLACVEMVVQDERLSRKDAAIVEEAILSKVSATGTWL